MAASLIQHLNQAGATAQHYPVIHISSIDHSDNLDFILNNLSNYDIAIFISPTAVQQTLAKAPSLPENLTLAVIGKSTEAVLKKYGYHAKIIPDEFDSESLLLHPDLAADKIANKSIIIFRGVGGRDLLGNTLSERGAKVAFAEVYKRDKNTLSSLTKSQLKDIDVLTITSNEGLQNLYDLTDYKSDLTKLPIIVPGIRAHQLASSLGFIQIIQASNATDDACLEALIQHYSA
ncbi:MAG: uroporphyrinogen-III synthase [Gammaproteobacteria bacterium]|nr:uroporphyrinogen-III synthase [Gammaproteobacteria bacterium]